MDGVSFKIEGAAELNKKLANINTDMRTKGGRFALRKAAQVVRDAARENAKRIDDLESRADIGANIVERWSNRTFKTTGNMMFRVGVMGGAGGRAKTEEFTGFPGGDTRHWRHVEFGTEKVPARPFMRPALEQNISKTSSVFVSEYSKKLDRLLK